MPYTKAFVFARLGQGHRLWAGTLSSEQGLGLFSYSDEWLSHTGAYPLDPVNLPLQNRTYRVRNRKAVFGVFSDAGPDDWGTRIMLMHNTSAPHNEIERLLRTSGGGVGLLEFSLSRSYPREPAPVPDISLLEDLERAAQRVEEHQRLTPEQWALIEPGSSMGGARPKVVVDDGGQQWLVKFSRQQDILDIPLLEYTTMNVLREAGADVPAIKFHALGQGRSAFIIQRFDRLPGHPRHVISAHSLFNTDRVRTVKDSRHNPYSYINLASILRKYAAAPERDCHELFRRMVFNILVGNTDDHARNHAMLYDTASCQWQLAPAYDVLPTINGNRGYQAMGVGANGAESTLENTLSYRKLFLLDEVHARDIIAQVQSAVAVLPERLQQAGMPPAAVDIVKGHMNL